MLKMNGFSLTSHRYVQLILPFLVRNTRCDNPNPNFVFCLLFFLVFFSLGAMQHVVLVRGDLCVIEHSSKIESHAVKLSYSKKDMQRYTIILSSYILGVLIKRILQIKPISL